jgi:hypothetical protein
MIAELSSAAGEPEERLRAGDCGSRTASADSVLTQRERTDPARGATLELTSRVAAVELAIAGPAGPAPAGLMGRAARRRLAPAAGPAAQGHWPARQCQGACKIPRLRWLCQSSVTSSTHQ